MKVPAYIGNPDPAVVAVVDPSSMRVQFVIEYVERYTASLIAVIVVSVIIIIFVISLRIYIILGSSTRPYYQCDYRENEGVS